MKRDKIRMSIKIIYFVHGTTYDNVEGKSVGIVAHRAPQLAFEVITKNISWEEANENDL